jgi:predicted outer membrane repeat protein
MYHNRFVENTADEGGALVIYDKATVNDCTFIDNQATVRGGAIYLDESNSTLENNLFVGNTAPGEWGGAAIYSLASFAEIRNSTFYENNAWAFIEEGIHTGGPYPCLKRAGSHIVNSVFHGSAPYFIAWDVTCGNLKTTSGIYYGVDPLFVDADSGDFHLSPESPCIDSGHGDYAPEFDMEGRPRLDDPGTPNIGLGDPLYSDIGAFEFVPAP